MRSNHLLSACIFFALSLANPLCAQTNWPQFRGPGGQGVSDAKSLPVTWSETQGITWKAPVHGKAWSSPVIWGNQIWLTTATPDGKELSVVTVDKQSGKITRNQKLFDVDNPQYCIPFNSYASPTPVVEEGRVYITFGSPGTGCLDMATGKTLWERRDFVCNHFRGAGSSLMLWNGMLFLNFDGSDHQFVVALDKNTGKTIWKTDRSMDYQDIEPNGRPRGDGDFRKAFSTCRIADFGSGPILLSEASKCFYAYEPLTGKEIWRCEYRKSHSCGTTPLVGKDYIYYTTGSDGTELWAMKPGGHGVVGDSQIAWKAKKAIPTRASPILVDDLIYMVADNGVISCIEAATGKDVWRGRADGTYSAAPIYGDGRVYFFSEGGKTTVVAGGRELKILGENQLADGIMAVPAVSDNALFLRTKTVLYRIDAPGKN